MIKGLRGAVRDWVLPGLRRIAYPWRLAMGDWSGLEVVYRQLLVREMARLGLEDGLWPVGSAANHSLLYLVLRACTELPVVRVLDVGAGQTSLLLDQLRLKLPKLEVVTLEHDQAWAARVKAQVKHKVLLRPLVRQQVAGRWTDFYDLAGLKGKFDLIIVDGPVGKARYSRLGMLLLLQKHVDLSNFMLIGDDAERAGEMQTLRVCRRWLAAQGAEFGENEVRAAKHQRVLAAGKMAPVLLF